MDIEESKNCFGKCAAVTPMFTSGLAAKCGHFLQVTEPLGIQCRMRISNHGLFEMSWSTHVNNSKDFLIQKKIQCGQCIGEDKMSPNWSF